MNDGSNDDDDDNNDNNDDEAIWESFDSGAAVVLLFEGCEDEMHLACRDLAAVPDGDWFCRTCQPSTVCFLKIAPSSGGGNSSFLHDSQGVDELATLDRYHHFHGHSGLCA